MYLIGHFNTYETYLLDLDNHLNDLCAKMFEKQNA